MSSSERHAALSGGSIVNRETPRNLAASVRQRLFNRAQEKHEDFGLVLTKYGLERVLEDDLDRLLKGDGGEGGIEASVGEWEVRGW